MAVANLTEAEIREALTVLDNFKASKIDATRLDPRLTTGKNISFHKDENKVWTLK